MAYEPDEWLVDNYREVAAQRGITFDDLADETAKQHGEEFPLVGFLRTLDKPEALEPEPDKPAKRTATPPAKRTAAAK